MEDIHAVNNTARVYRLEDHLEDCEERYASVVNRLETIDARLDRMENTLQDIKDLLSNVRYKTQ
jgi:hypothetical protein